MTFARLKSQSAEELKRLRSYQAFFSQEAKKRQVEGKPRVIRDEPKRCCCCSCGA